MLRSMKCMPITLQDMFSDKAGAHRSPPGAGFFSGCRFLLRVPVSVEPADLSRHILPPKPRDQQSKNRILDGAGLHWSPPGLAELSRAYVTTQMKSRDQEG